MYFFGRHDHSLDEKSRLMLPTRLRDQLKGQLYMTIGLDKCINLYTSEAFMKIANQRASLNDLSKEERGFMRTFFSNSIECEMDKQGRILLPKNLQKSAFISKDVVVIGNNDHIEIWDKEHYEQVELEQLENFETNAQIIGERFKKED